MSDDSLRPVSPAGKKKPARSGRSGREGDGNPGAPRPAPPNVVVRWLSRLLLLAVILALFAAAGLWGLFVLYTRDLPDLDKVGEYQPKQLVRVLDRNGNVLGEIGEEKRTVIPYARMPKMLINAVVAAEDATFFKNTGLDLKGIARALFENVVRGRTAQGGSTITQQVIKRLLLTPERTIKRKVQELVLAYRLTKKLKKEQILEIYLNDIYFGHGRYGCEEASRFFFGKSVGEIDVAEAALLAGLPQSPERLSPLKHPEEAKTRQRYVLSRLAELNFVPRPVAEALAKEPIAIVNNESLSHAPEVMTLVNAMGGGALTAKGGSVQTTIDADLQALARAALEKGLEALDARQGFREPLARLTGAALAIKRKELAKQAAKTRGGAPPAEGKIVDAVVIETIVEAGNPDGGRLLLDLGGSKGVVVVGDEPRYRPGKKVMTDRFPAGSVVRVRVVGGGPDAGRSGAPIPVALELGPQAAMVVLDIKTSGILAVVGGYDFRTGSFDRSKNAQRQPGSAWKPFVYGAAIETRKFTPASVINDAPEVYDLWKPANYSKSFRGPVRLRTALEQSINTVAIKLLAETGIGTLKEFALRMGVESVDDAAGLSLALGSLTLSPLDLAGAYLPFFNGGFRVRPRLFLRIGDRDEPEPVRSEAIKPDVAFVMLSMMQSVVTVGTAAAAGAALQRPAAGKTGTSDGEHDAWFVGGTPDYLAAVWVGFDDMRVLGRGETGTRAALPIWIDFMKKAHEGLPVRDFAQPSNVQVHSIDPRTGFLPAPGTTGIDEVFLSGTEPTETAAGAEGSADRMLFTQ